MRLDKETDKGDPKVKKVVQRSENFESGKNPKSPVLLDRIKHIFFLNFLLRETFNFMQQQIYYFKSNYTLISFYANVDLT